MHPWCGKRRCRKGRPLCSKARPQPCTCPAYHYPHRWGSGRCNHSPNAAKLQWEAVYGKGSWDRAQEDIYEKARELGA